MASEILRKSLGAIIPFGFNKTIKKGLILQHIFIFIYKPALYSY